MARCFEAAVGETSVSCRGPGDPSFLAAILSTIMSVLGPSVCGRRARAFPGHAAFGRGDPSAGSVGVIRGCALESSGRGWDSGKRALAIGHGFQPSQLAAPGHVN